MQRVPSRVFLLVLTLCYSSIVLADDGQHTPAAISTAQSLVGTQLSEAVIASGHAGDEYLAGTVQLESQPELRIYRRPPGGSFQEVWHEGFSGYTLSRLNFILWQDDRSPSLAFVATAVGGNTATSERVYIYSLDKQRLFYIEYSPVGDINAVRPTISITANTAVKEPTIESWLERWAHDLQIDGTGNSDSDTLIGMEDEWLEANQRVTNGRVHITFHPRIKGTTNSTGTSVETGHYKWSSYFKAGVVGFDKQQNRYFVLYVPADKYEWIIELRVAGEYIYMKSANSDESGHYWTVRVRQYSEANNAVFVLERGNFDPLMQPGAAATATAKPAQPRVDANDSQWRQPSPIEDGRILLFIIPALATIAMWWAGRRRRDRAVASGWGEKEFRRAAFVVGGATGFAALLVFHEFKDAGKTSQHLAQEKCGDVKAGEYGGTNLLDSTFNCLVQHGLAKEPSQEDLGKMAKALNQAMDEEPPSAGVTVRAYELLKNPYRFKHSVIVLDVMSRPVLYNGSVVQYAAGVNPRIGAQLGMLGLRFNRMIDEDTGLYDVIGVNATYNSGDEMLGQLAVVIPKGRGELDLGRYWKVEPLGTAEGNNAFGATLSVPLVKFWRYADEQQE